MKKLLIVLLIVFTVFGISSCTLISGLFYPYIGIWENLSTQNGTDLRTLLTLEKESYEMLIRYKKADGTWADMMAFRGTMVVEGVTMTQTPVETKAFNYTTEVIAEEWSPVAGDDALPSIGTWAVADDVLTFVSEDSAVGTLTFSRVE